MHTDVDVIGDQLVAHKQHPPENSDPQTYERQPPVVLLLPNGQRSTETPYRAPAGLFAPSSARTVGERKQWVQDEW